MSTIELMLITPCAVGFGALLLGNFAAYLRQKQRYQLARLVVFLIPVILTGGVIFIDVLNLVSSEDKAGALLMLLPINLVAALVCGVLMYIYIATYATNQDT